MLISKKLGLLVITVFLTSILSIVLNVHRVNASETITISADGSINPPTAPILNSANITYTLTGDINGTILVYRSNIILDGAGCTIYGNGSNEGITNYHGLGLDNVTVRNVNVDNVYRGVFFTGSSNLRIIGNNITNAANIGIHIHDSSDCKVSDNYLEYISLGNPPNGAGINIDWLSDRNIVTGNTIKNSEQGVMVSGFCHGSIVSMNNITNTFRGIQLNNDISYGNITGNRIVGSEYGIDTGGYNPCVNNTVNGNVLMDNKYGLYFPNFVNNAIYHNHFINNSYHALDPYNSSANFWNQGDEGNYWDDYSIKYPNATEADGSGIWDTPYVIDANNIDYYPLVPMDTTPPNITDVTQDPDANNVLPEDAVKVNATVIDDSSGVKRVSMNYTNSNGTWTLVDMTNLVANVWNATIPSFPNGTIVTCAITADDYMNNTITTEDMGYNYQYTVIPEFPSLIVFSLFLIATLLATIFVKRKRLTIDVIRE